MCSEPSIYILTFRPWLSFPASQITRSLLKNNGALKINAFSNAMGRRLGSDKAKCSNATLFQAMFSIGADSRNLK